MLSKGYSPVNQPLHTLPHYVTCRRQWAALIAALVMLDGIVVWGSLMLAFVLRISSGLLPYYPPVEAAIYRTLVLAALPVWWALLAIVGAYRRDDLLGGVAEYARVARASTSGMIALVMLSFWWRDLIVVSRGWLLLSWGLSCLLLVLERFLVRRVVYRLRRLGCFTSRVLIMGANEQGIAIASHWTRSATSGMRVVGFVDDFKPVGTPVVDGLEVVGQPSRLTDIVRQYGAHEVVVVPSAVSWETFEGLVVQASNHNGYTIRFSPGSYELLTTGVTVTEKSFVPLVTINENRIVGIDALLKTLLDYGLGVPLLLGSSPLLALIALALSLERGRGPAVRRLTVLGREQKPFVMFKFRSQPVPNTPDRTAGVSSPVASLVAWLECALYRTGLDKWPQLLNVVAGQMSLVGPRPRLLDEGADPRTLHNLCTVKPGVVGPWLGERGRTLENEWQSELYYIRSWTIWLDLQNLFRALQGMWRGRERAEPVTQES
jgi:lipopolysaccharide/colanic/teichoic acid biosynthesis glycosyltransferase